MKQPVHVIVVYVPDKECTQGTKRSVWFNMSDSYL
jgi:hypothetical protein